MDSDLKKIETWLDPLLKGLKPVERKQTNRRIAAGLRKRQAQRIAAQQNPDGSQFTPRRKLRDKSGRIRRKAMFKKLRTTKHLKAQSTEDKIEVGYNGKTARIVKEHMQGVGNLPKRTLIGWSAEDEEWVLEQIKSAFDL